MTFETTGWETDRCLAAPGHATLLHDGKQDIKVPQSDTATDAVRPFHGGLDVR